MTVSLRWPMFICYAGILLDWLVFSVISYLFVRPVELCDLLSVTGAIQICEYVWFGGCAT